MENYFLMMLNYYFIAIIAFWIIFILAILFSMYFVYGLHRRIKKIEGINEKENK